MVVGSNWRFGRNRAGDADRLSREAAQRGWEAIIVAPELDEGKPISSTRVRHEIAAGHLESAARMLGRRFSIYGTVVAGKKVGRTLGYPTINLDPHNEVRPPPGIYAVWVNLEGQRFAGAAFLADLPHAVSGPSGFLVEVHLLDFDQDVYGKDAEVVFVRWIRAPIEFDSRDALKEQIRRDVDETRRILKEDEAAC